jgi:predicted transcriptional regulator
MSHYKTLGNDSLNVMTFILFLFLIPTFFILDIKDMIFYVASFSLWLFISRFYISHKEDDILDRATRMIYRS